MSISDRFRPHWPPALTSGRASRQLAWAGVTGLVVGLVVAGFDEVVTHLLFEVTYELPTWQQALAPGAGLVATALVLRWLGQRVSPSTADEYVRSYHDRSRRLRLRDLGPRLLAGVATVGAGGSLGLEGPAIYAGATVGDVIQHRLSRFFTREEAKVLLVAGAAAGVAAIFKAPATGVVFALEVPYRSDLARRALLPALVAAASSYLVFVLLLDTDPLLPSLGTQPSFEVTGIVGAVVVGVLAGLGARAFVWLTLQVKTLTTRVRLRWRLSAAAVVLGGLVVSAEAVFGEPLTMGPGFATVDWAADPSHGVGLVVLLLALRAVATTTTLAGGGSGGLFIPLAALGVLLGRAVGEVLGRAESALYPTLGLAAFLGAGYRVPLAAVMFVAESTGGSAFVVSALLAAAVSQLVVGPRSVTPYQRVRGRGHLEERLDLPLRSVLTTDVLTVPPDATVEEFVVDHVVGRRQRSVPVVEGNRYLGMCRFDAVTGRERDTWPVATVADVADTDAPAARPGWVVRDVLAAMEAADSDVVAVVDDDGGFVGIVTSADVLALGDILDETGDGPRGG